jgi:Na+-transporting methylmalonyl-CoA/oxaloacetate decarboxylase gamma subunit
MNEQAQSKLIEAFIQSPWLGITLIILIIAIVLIVLLILSKFTKKVGPFEFKDKSKMSSLPNSSKQTMMNVITQTRGYAEDYERDRKDIEHNLHLNQIEKTKVYLNDAINMLNMNYISSAAPSVKNQKIDDLADLLGLFLNRDFNEIVYVEVNKILDHYDLSKSNDDFMRAEVERISAQSVNALQARFLRYPSMIDKGLLSKIFDEYKPQMNNAIGSMLRDCRVLSIDAIKEQQKLRENYDSEINNIINTLFPQSQPIKKDL